MKKILKIAIAIIGATIITFGVAQIPKSTRTGKVKPEDKPVKVEVSTQKPIELIALENVTELTTESTEVSTECTEEVTEEENPLYSLPLGHYTLTAYEWTGNTCANGEYPTEGYTIACNSLPLGTRVYIEGYGFYTVEDRGGMADNVIDIYLGDYDECIEFGVQEADVYLIKED